MTPYSAWFRSEAVIPPQRNEDVYVSVVLLRCWIATSAAKQGPLVSCLVSLRSSRYSSEAKRGSPSLSFAAEL